MQLFDLK